MMRATMVFVLAAMASLSGCHEQASPAVSPSSVPSSGHTASTKVGLPLQATMDLGVVVQGTSLELRKRIRNEGQSALHIAQIKRSCDCLEVRLSQMRIEAGARVLVHLHYDGAKEPEFVGSLEIEVELLDDQGTKVGLITVPLEVVRADAVGDAHR